MKSSQTFKNNSVKGQRIYPAIQFIVKTSQESIKSTESTESTQSTQYCNLWNLCNLWNPWNLRNSQNQQNLWNQCDLQNRCSTSKVFFVCCWHLSKLLWWLLLICCISLRGQKATILDYGKDISRQSPHSNANKIF